MKQSDQLSIADIQAKIQINIAINNTMDITHLEGGGKLECKKKTETLQSVNSGRSVHR